MVKNESLFEFQEELLDAGVDCLNDLLTAYYHRHDAQKTFSAKALNEKFESIKNRIENSIDEDMEIPLCQVIDRLNLKPWEAMFLLVYVLIELLPELRLTFQQVFYAKESKVTLKMVYDLYRFVQAYDESTLFELLSHEGNLWFCLDADEELGLLSSARPCAALLKYCFNDQMNDELRLLCRVYLPFDRLGKQLAYEKQKKMLEVVMNKKANLNVILIGRRQCGRKFSLRLAAGQHDKDVFCVDAVQFLTLEMSAFKTICRQLWLLAKLHDAWIVFDGLKESDSPARFQYFRSKWQGLLFFTAEENISWLDKKMVIEYEGLSAAQKGQCWAYFLSKCKCEHEVDPWLNGSKYVLQPGEIKTIVQSAERQLSVNQTTLLTQAAINQAMKQNRKHELNELAAYVPARFTWSDLIVEPHVRKEMEYFCNHVKYRNIVGDEWNFNAKMPYGRGVSALFYGPPGTGKTMAVQVIANELGLDLYRIDISRMVSKYIGETEKNITELFEKAKDINALLFFDEADAFFAKRSQVQDANDRNANAEVAHLLQKLETYEGVTVMATNLKDNIDDAFKRRINFMIDFQFPNKETRRVLWRQLLPKEAPVEEELDLDFFADHFELAGSGIKEILVNAAYMAAAQQEKIGHRQLMEATILYFKKYGKLLSEADFGYLAG